MNRQLLFIQGGGAGTHDEWDNKLVESLVRSLGPDYEIRYPRMPNEDAPTYVAWKAALERELAALDDGAILVGHSLGGTMLVNALAGRRSEQEFGAIFLIAPPSLARAVGQPMTSSCHPTLGRGFPPASPFIFTMGSQTKRRRHRTRSSSRARFRRHMSTACRAAIISSTTI